MRVEGYASKDELASFEQREYPEGLEILGYAGAHAGGWRLDIFPTKRAALAEAVDDPIKIRVTVEEIHD